MPRPAYFQHTLSSRSVAVQRTPVVVRRADPRHVLQRAITDPGSITPSDAKVLQRTVGNQATRRLLSPVLPHFSQSRPIAAPQRPEEKSARQEDIQAQDVEQRGRVRLSPPPTGPDAKLSRVWRRELLQPTTPTPSVQRSAHPPRKRVTLQRPGSMDRQISPVTQSAGSTVTAHPSAIEHGDSHTLQRTLLRHKPQTLGSTVEVQGEQKAKVVDDTVTDAFNEFKNGDFAGASDAQVALYAFRKQQYDNGDHTIHPSTAAGYVIEGKANQKLEQKGYSIQVTGLLKGTRPDIAFLLPGNTYGLVDITASDSAGHIFKKKGNWTGHAHIPYVAESLYPSINFDAPGDTPELTEEQVRLAMQRAQESSDWKDYVEQEKAADQERKYDIWQQAVLDQFARYVEIARTATEGLKWRMTYREQSAWENIGLLANINEEKKQWEITSQSYEEWKNVHPLQKVSLSAFDKVMEQINLKGRDKDPEDYHRGYLPRLGETTGRETKSGAIRRERKSYRSEPYTTREKGDRRLSWRNAEDT